MERTYKKTPRISIEVSWTMFADIVRLNLFHFSDRIEKTLFRVIMPAVYAADYKEEINFM